MTYLQTTTSGHLLVIALALNSGGNNAVPATISDTNNNTWKQACRAQTTGVNSFSAEIWYAENCKGGANHKITVTPAISAYVAYSIAEYSGVAATNALDQKTTNSAGSASPSAAPNSGNVSTTTAGALYVGAAQWGGVNLAATTEPSWTSVYANTPTATTSAVSVETLGEAAVAAAGSYAAAWSLNSPHPWAACLATFLPVPPNPFQGKIEEVAIYTKVLSPENIATHGMAAYQN